LAAVICLFEQSLDTQAVYSAPDPDMQQRTILCGEIAVALVGTFVGFIPAPLGRQG
jgi:hypothetical protein